MAANQNVTQIPTVQTGSANTSSLFYAVISGTTDTQLPFSVFVNNLGLTGVSTAPTAATGTNTTQIASTAFVQAQLTSSLAPYAPLSGAALTSATVTASTINSTPIGQSTAAAGAFTNLSASGTVTGTGFTAFLSSPTAIGNTAPNTGAFTTLSASGLITPNSTAGIKGTATNDSAQAGSVGEYVSSQVNGTSMTSASPLSLTSITLTAGDWDVQACGRINPAGTTTVANFAVSASTTNNALGGLGSTTQIVSTFAIGQTQLLNSPTLRVSVATSTVVYVVVNVGFGVSTLTADGFIRARRVR